LKLCRGCRSKIYIKYKIDEYVHNIAYITACSICFYIFRKIASALHLWLHKKGMGIMTKDKMKQQHEEYMEEERAKLKARIDEIDDEFRLYLLESFLDGLLDDENC
jgi:hypothetical protein